MENDLEVRPQKRRRVERGRSKNGCSTCSAKKVKCDEQQPRCNRCVRLGLPCEWATQQPPLASRRRGLGPIKQRSSWTPQAITPKANGDEPETSDLLTDIDPFTIQESATEPVASTGFDHELQRREPVATDRSLHVFQEENGVPASAMTGFSELISEDIINSIVLPELDQDDSLDATAQLVLYPTPSFNLLSVFPTFSFTYPTDPAPSIGSDDVQAMTFHSTVLAPMKSTRKAALSSHSIFLNFAIQNPMALHFLLAFSHSELAIHQGYSHRPPLESYLHFQHGSQLFNQAVVALTPTNHIAMMLSFLYLYMFWMRRDPFDVSRLRELSSSVLAYVTTFSLDELCANTTGDAGASEPVTLSRTLTYIYDRDVFCGFFGCDQAFADYVGEKHDTRQRIWQLSRMPILSSVDPVETWFGSEQLPGTSQRRILNVYFSLITIQYEINRYSQGSEMEGLAADLEIRRKLERIREEQNCLFEVAANHAQQATQPPLMALVTVTIFHALQIYLHRSRDSALGGLPVPVEVDKALKGLVTTAYHTIAAGPVQLLERFQWALLIAGIETHDPVHRDWVSANISDPVIKGVYNLVLSAKGMSDKGISMQAVRDLVSKQPWEGARDTL
ncbi:hypothetical protein FSARC_7237 [Fusarium sarcochroum]|uniref:Zn(2)-C6 fungal-type domain-containing protein n=1 Tax=Fusarium sarcochroum TaxID=1208366 RepID=A0A8H4X7I8_9HYPO|nr:hypothetical protein FSARC_7237 [Fusarium sarcochroum]